MNKTYRAIIAILGILFVFYAVRYYSVNQKYENLLSQKVEMEVEIESLKSKLSDANIRIESLEEDNALLRKDIRAYESDGEVHEMSLFGDD